MVPVLDKDKKPLMPCTERRAKVLMEKGKAKPYWCKGIFCIILQEEPKSRFMQDIVVAIDPGSKFNGYTVKSEAHTLKNLQVNAITDVKSRMDERRSIRRDRRNRKTPYRKCRYNRKCTDNSISPSTKSRWQQHLNIIKWMEKLYRVTCVVIEDVMAGTKKGCKKWNSNFSPIQRGKNWFEQKVSLLNLKLYKYRGYDTYNMRKELGLKKNKDKSKKCFHTHCVDSWCLATKVIGGNNDIDSKHVTYLKPLRYFKRKLHHILSDKNGNRKPYGGTMSLGIKRGTLVKHYKHGLSLVGGNSKLGISLHDIITNKRLCQNSKKEDLEIRTILKYNIA